MADREGKEKMMEDWEKVLIAIFRAQSGEIDVRHNRDDDGGVVGITGELILGFEMALPKNFTKDSEKAVEIAKAEAEAANTSEDEITPKQKIMINWFEIRNAIVRAETGEMKVTHHMNNVPGGGVVGVTVEWVMEFGKVVDAFITEEEKALVDAAHE